MNGEQVQAENLFILKHGINHVTALVKAQKAKLVIIAKDADPSECVAQLPDICNKKKVPFAVSNPKVRLGTLVNKKSASVIAFTNLRPEDIKEFNLLVADIRNHFSKARN